jgi:hypothetical protein
VRAYGEMVALLWDAGNVAGAIELEALWNDLLDDVRFGLFCAYPSASVAGHGDVEASRRVCDLHTSVISVPAPPMDLGQVSRGFRGVPDSVGAARRYVQTPWPLS